MGDSGGGAGPVSDPPVHPAHDCDSEMVQNNAQSETNRLIVISCAVVMASYLLGVFQVLSFLQLPKPNYVSDPL